MMVAREVELVGGPLCGMREMVNCAASVAEIAAIVEGHLCRLTYAQQRDGRFWFRSSESGDILGWVDTNNGEADDDSSEEESGS